MLPIGSYHRNLASPGWHEVWKSGDGIMDRKRVRNAAFSEWLLEFSVLWAVFPFLDQLLDRARTFDYVVLIVGFAIAIMSGVLGVWLRPEE